jgi:glycosyltransferase involved in cell wall biosynthesis
MHLVINGSDLGRQRGGNESYLAGLLDGMAAVIEDIEIRISLIVASEGAHLAASVPAWHRFAVINVGRYRRLPYLLLQQTEVLRRLRPDWYVSTFFLPLVLPCRAAVLIHDLSFRAHPEYFPRSIAAYMRLLTGQAMHRADAVIALSRFTRQEIQRFYPAARQKAAVVYPGVGSEFRPAGNPDDDAKVLATLGVERPYLLTVGNIHPRKNLARLLAAWEQLRRLDQRVPRMVWVGVGHWKSGQLLTKARESGVHLLGFVQQAFLPVLYRQSEAFLYPSLYEGFGLPPIEAMACGTPTLVSDATSLREAVGEASLLVDASNVGTLVDGLAQVLFEQELRDTLRERGLARAAQFSWEQTARQLLETLEGAST